jgi:hypothetical protein
MVTARVLGKVTPWAGLCGQPEREMAVTVTVTVEGLHCGMLVAELLRRTGVALGLHAGSIKLMLRHESRWLKAEETLAGAEVSAGCVLDVCVGESGGMPVGCFGFGSQQTINSLRLQVREAEERHKEAENRLQGEVDRLRILSQQALGTAGAPAYGVAATAFSVASLQGFTQPARFSEEDEDKELLDLLFDEIDTDKNSTISNSELNAALGKHNMQNELKEILESLLPTVGQLSGPDSITRESFGRAFEKLPRVRGERVKWARGLGIEGLIARVLPKGDICDGLKGLRMLPESELPALAQSVTVHLVSVLPGLIFQELKKLQSSNVAPSAAAEALSHVNSKFCLDGAFVGQYATLNDFYHGPEALIGTPNPRIEEGMEIEHCRRENKDIKFTTSNYNVQTWPSLEWEFVVAPKSGTTYPHTPSDKSKWKADQVWSQQSNTGWKGDHGRDPIGIVAFFAEDEDTLHMALHGGVLGLAEIVKKARAEIRKACLLRGEVIGLRLYTGPMFMAYNAVLRGFPMSDVEMLKGNKYETTIFVITSGITKVSKISDLPANRLVYRGLGGQILPRQF